MPRCERPVGRGPRAADASEPARLPAARRRRRGAAPGQRPAPHARISTARGRCRRRSARAAAVDYRVGPVAPPPPHHRRALDLEARRRRRARAADPPPLLHAGRTRRRDARGAPSALRARLPGLAAGHRARQGPRPGGGRAVRRSSARPRRRARDGARRAGRPGGDSGPKPRLRLGRRAARSRGGAKGRAARGAELRRRPTEPSGNDAPGFAFVRRKKKRSVRREHSKRRKNDLKTGRRPWRFRFVAGASARGRSAGGDAAATPRG
mmetsp:Transcript_4292/g.12592  ORF Transcript_4292/g.12592 Transcript_4292/m.12592 type:complete len:266 (+) Transcript_4292:683-1480(+)